MLQLLFVKQPSLPFPSLISCPSNLSRGDDVDDERIILSSFLFSKITDSLSLDEQHASSIVSLFENIHIDVKM